MKFRLSRQPQLPGDTLTRFHVLSDDSTVGIITVPSEAAADLERHWLQPQAAAPTKKGSALAAALEANKRPGALPPDHASKKENPAVAAMLAAAKKNRLSQAAILRGC